MQTRRSQQGLSLVSLMIALTIGAFLLAGLFDMWFQTRNSFTAQNQMAQLQDSQRQAMTILAYGAQSGGYWPFKDNYANSPPSPLLSASVALPAASLSFAGGTVSFAAGQFLFGTTAASSTTSDTFATRYMSDGSTLDCQGQVQADRTLITNLYTIDGNGNLQCSVITQVYNASASTPTTAQTLISGVSNFSVVYGVAPGGAATQTTEYLSAAQVTSSGNWANVHSLNLSLTFKNPLSGQPGQNTTVPTINRIVAVTQGSTL